MVWRPYAEEFCHKLLTFEVKMRKFLYLLSLPIRIVGFSILAIITTIIYVLINIVNIIVDFKESDFKESFDNFYCELVDMKNMCFRIKKD